MPSDEKLGVWIIGGLGGLATTVVVGARAVARGLVSTTGLLTEQDWFSSMRLVELGNLVFGGHEIRRGSLVDSAREISRQNGSIHQAWIHELREQLDLDSSEVRIGVSEGGGGAIRALDESGQQQVGPGTAAQRIVRDIEEFRSRNGLDRVVVVNLASTEPPTDWTEAYLSLPALEEALRRDEPGSLRPGVVYAHSAFVTQSAYINFTPSNSALCPATEELATSCRVPYAGSDGKTGETLVKSALAPMFRHRSLHVDSWMGYNLLGNRDGEVLSHEENKRSKVIAKDGVLSAILGYPPHTRVGIDLVPSLLDSKVAWDYIHFRGFLDHKMSMQFTWQGCDSVLAAPVVLDLVRLVDQAARAGRTGPQAHLACFFKRPIHCDEYDLHRQMQLLVEYVGEVADPAGS